MKNTKEQKGRAIAEQFQLKFDGEKWTVPSQTGKNDYTVELLAQICTCPDFNKTAVKCKHIFAVEERIRREHRAIFSPEREKTARKKPTYKQNWKTYNPAQQNEKLMFQSLLFELCRGIQEAPNRRGRPRARLRDITYCICSKTFNGLAARRNDSDVQDAFEKGYISQEIHYNTLYKYLDGEDLTSILREMIELTASVMKPVETEFAFDSSGFSTCQYKRWFDVKYGGDESWHDWYKLHLACGVKTGIVTAVEISERYANDSPFYKKLFDSTLKLGFLMKRTVADAAYANKINLNHSADHGVEQFSEFKSNAVFDAKDTVWNKMLHFFLYRQDEFYQIYHRRSKVEALFSAMKRKYGSILRTRNPTAQINEILTKVLCYNIGVIIRAIYELKIEPQFFDGNSFLPEIQSVTDIKSSDS